MNKISVAIATRNEEKNIKDCLESISWADEIVVFDEKSTDKTVAIAKKYTSRVYLVDHDPMFHKTKQKAINKCTGDWVFQLDADERVTPELKKEVLLALGGHQTLEAFRVPRRSQIFGKRMEHTGWYPDYQIKLFKRGKGHYPCQTVHEDIEISGEVGTLKSDLWHFHYKTVSEYLLRHDDYTTNDALYLLSKGESVVWSDAIRFPIDEFLKRFFFWEGYKDGLHGLVLSLLQAFDRLIVFAKIWEKQKFWQYNDASFRQQVIDYSGKARQDWNHWLAVTEKHPLKKILRKTLNKVRP